MVIKTNEIEATEYHEIKEEIERKYGLSGDDSATAAQHIWQKDEDFDTELLELDDSEELNTNSDAKTTKELYEITKDDNLLKLENCIVKITELSFPDKPNMYHVVEFQDGTYLYYIDELAFWGCEDWADFLTQIDNDAEILAAIENVKKSSYAETD